MVAVDSDRFPLFQLDGRGKNFILAMVFAEFGGLDWQYAMVSLTASSRAPQSVASCSGVRGSFSLMNSQQIVQAQMRVPLMHSC